MDRNILRHIDVCSNRIQEAARLLDELCRFHFNLPKLQKELKEFRHKIKNVFSLDYKVLLKARDSINDNGFNYTIKGEAERIDLEAIIKASSKRIIESLRILEEYAKLPGFYKLVTLNIEKERQRFYEIEKILLLKINKLEITEKIYPINPENYLDDFLLGISKCSSFFQLRLKQKSKSEIFKIIKEIKLKYPDLKIIINDHLDLVLAEDLAGIHLGQDDLPLKVARKLLGSNKIIGISTHNLEQALKAQEDGADYIGFGPIFPTKSKDTGYKPRGLQMLTEISDKINIPIIAIGGISKDNFSTVIKAGATSCALISELTENTAIKYNSLLNTLNKG